MTSLGGAKIFHDTKRNSVINLYLCTNMQLDDYSLKEDICEKFEDKRGESYIHFNQMGVDFKVVVYI